MRIVKGIIIFIIVITVLIIGFVVFRNPLIKSAVTTGASQVTGVPVQMEGFSLGIFSQDVRIKGFRLYNPEGFPREAIIDIPEISVDYDIGSLLKGKLHLPYIALNLKEVAVVRNKEGKFNIDVLRTNLMQGKPSEEEAEEEEVEEEEEEEAGEPSKPMEMQIDVMKVSIGKVTYKDYSKGDEPLVKSFDAGVKEKTFRDITSAQDFGIKILKEVIGPTILKSAIAREAASAIGLESLPTSAEDVADIAGGFLSGKDGNSAEFDAGYGEAFTAALKTIQDMGKVTKEDEDDGEIKAKVEGCKVTVEISEKGAERVKIKVSAKKIVIPQPKLAKKILSGIAERLQ